MAQDSPQRPKRVIQDIREKTTTLVEFPKIDRPGRVMGTRELVVHKNDIVAYRVRGEDVEIIRVHLVAKRWPAVFD